MIDESTAIGEAIFTLANVAIRRRDRTLSLTAMSTLVTLERTGPRRLTDLAVAEDVTQPSMTALVRQLADLGLVERRRDPADARVVLVALVAAGHHQIRTVRRAGASVLAELIDKLDAREAETLRAALPALRRLTELVVDDNVR